MRNTFILLKPSAAVPLRPSPFCPHSSLFRSAPLFPSNLSAREPNLVQWSLHNGQKGNPSILWAGMWYGSSPLDSPQSHSPRTAQERQTNQPGAAGPGMKPPDQQGAQVFGCFKGWRMEDFTSGFLCWWIQRRVHEQMKKQKKLNVVLEEGAETDLLYLRSCYIPKGIRLNLNLAINTASISVKLLVPWQNGLRKHELRMIRPQNGLE